MHGMLEGTMSMVSVHIVSHTHTHTHTYTVKYHSVLLKKERKKENVHTHIHTVIRFVPGTCCYTVRSGEKAYVEHTTDSYIRIYPRKQCARRFSNLHENTVKPL